MKKKDMFTPSTAFDMSRFTVGKAEVAHQNMMKQITDAGWGQKRWLGVWGRLIKRNAEQLGFSPDNLATIIKKGQELERAGKANARGFVRNRLQNGDWRKYL